MIKKNGRRDNSKSIYDFKKQKKLLANTCDTFSFDVNLDSCERGTKIQWFDIVLKGTINNGQDRCFCYDFNQAYSLISDGPTTR